jgi:Tfp pilus assembly protein PilF
VDVKRRFAMTVILGTGVGLTGCQGGGLGKLALWNRGDSSVASTAPDVSRQKYAGLQKEFGSAMPMGQARTGTAALGGQKPVSDDGFITASWKKTTAAVTGAFASTTKPANPAPDDDPLRLDRNPTKIGPEVYVSAARLLENQGKVAEAEVKYNDALKSSPTDEAALVGLARLHDRQGQSLKAVEFYHKALKAHPNSGLVCNDLGLCYRRQRQLDKSIQAFSRAVELQPDNDKYRNNLAAAFVDAGRPSDAVKHLSLTSSPAVANYNVGFMMLQKGQRAEAAQYLQQALSIDPGLTPAREMLVQLGGNNGATPLASRPQPQFSQPQLSHPTISQSGRHYESPAPYVASEPAAAAPSSPQTYHVGDDPPAAETAQRQLWNGSAWSAAVDGESSLPTPPLPPVE